MRILYSSFLFLTLLLFCALQVHAQCLPNVGFEDGTFTNWVCKAGTINLSTKQEVFTLDGVQPGRHTMLTNTSPQAIDNNGGFPVNCPNGSGHSIMLGNAQGKSETEAVMYTYTIPNTATDFTLTYYYAIVLQNNSQHTANQQAKFVARIYNVTDDKYETCGSFEFTALAGNSGFIQGATTISGTGNNVTNNTIYYKPWTPITVNLQGYQGKTIRLEFITRDCAPNQVGSHFAYAYIDVAENCKIGQSPITGNSYCRGAADVTLKAPPGFESYEWFNASDLTTVIGTGPNLKLTPPPADGTVYTVKLTPYDGYGCPSVLSATATAIDEEYRFVVTNKVLHGCANDGYDITAAAVTSGSSSNLTFEYFTDAGGQNYLSDPKRITQSGTYYIRGTNTFGCAETKSVQVIIEPNPTLTVAVPQPVCAPATIDITTRAVITDYNPNLSYTYWKNAEATIPVPNPAKIGVSGMYYIKAANKVADDGTPGCSVIKQVPVIVGELPNVVTHDFGTCPPASLTNAQVTSGSTSGLSYTYWLDAAGTQVVPKPDSITVSGTYYIKGTTDLGCTDGLKPVNVTVYPLPALTVNDPNPVIYPATVNIGRSYAPGTGNTYTYWKNAAATMALYDYTAIAESGTYYIKAVTEHGCELIRAVNVVIYPPPLPQVISPNTFTPNGDGINDLYKPVVEGIASINHLTIYNRWGQLMFESRASAPIWDGRYNGQIQATGTYYWIIEATDTYRKVNFTRSGYIAIVK